MNSFYSLSRGVTLIEGMGILPTYGIIATDDNGKRISEFSDVSVNKSFTENIVKLLNDCKVDSCHFYDVVTDELNR